MTEAPKRDFRQEVTDDIIRLLESGTAPWQKPWENRNGGLPVNPTTGKPYRGGNILCLMIAGLRHGFTDPRWCTYKQSAEKGWQVRKGEKASHIEFWEARGTREDDGESDADKPRASFVHRVYAVFNAQQIDGIPAIDIEPRKPFEVIQAGDDILNYSGAEFHHGGNRAYYSRIGDYIQLPDRDQFIDAPSYYATGCHELIHWSGHQTRLNRETLMKARACSHDDNFYAREELVAEIGSMMLAAETGLPHDPSQHVAYVASWLEALKKDKSEIFRAASAASKATDFVLGVRRDHCDPPTTGAHAEQVLSSRTHGARCR